MSRKTLILEFGIVGSLGRAERGVVVENGRGVSLVGEAREVLGERARRRENMAVCSIAARMTDCEEEDEM